MSNHLQGQTSPYLLQHAENPVDWFPWGQEAFEKAEREDKPVFLSIGYSTCHWCHVMARESFEDEEIAALLNRHFVAVKVDKEERPDLDSVYMAACQAFTGSGGWPMSVFMTARQEPFFAGTYFPKTARRGALGLRELLLLVSDRWERDRAALLRSAADLVRAMNSAAAAPVPPEEELLERALAAYRQSFDRQLGGFGGAPKFPAAHNLLFLLQAYEKRGDRELLHMAEKTLGQLYRGGIFDHIGGGFCRYSTDRYYLVPHFEKMLCDNALLILALCKAWAVTKNGLYRRVAEKTAQYVLSEMTSDAGGFYSAQDADSDGVEGKYYVFTPRELKELLGDAEGEAFCRHYGITESGNFAGGSIPNLLPDRAYEARFEQYMPRLRAYRKRRAALHRDDKCLTFWNALMIAALCALYRSTQSGVYLQAAKRAQRFIEERLCQGDTLFVSWRDGRRGGRGFLEDYAGYIYALLALYEATLDKSCLRQAGALTARAAADFFDAERGGFYLYGRDGETLIARPKETYDGAVPSGNSLMAYNLVRLGRLEPEGDTAPLLQKQLRYMAGEADRAPAGHAMLLLALSDYFQPPALVTVVRGGGSLETLPFYTARDTVFRVLDEPEGGYRRLDGENTFYVCRDDHCLAPMGEAAFRASLERNAAPTS